MNISANFAIYHCYNSISEIFSVSQFHKARRGHIHVFAVQVSHIAGWKQLLWLCNFYGKNVHLWHSLIMNPTSEITFFRDSFCSVEPAVKLKVRLQTSFNFKVKFNSESSLWKTFAFLVLNLPRSPEFIRSLNHNLLERKFLRNEKTCWAKNILKRQAMHTSNLYANNVYYVSKCFYFILLKIRKATEHRICLV